MGKKRKRTSGVYEVYTLKGSASMGYTEKYISQFSSLKAARKYTHPGKKVGVKYNIHKILKA